MNHFPQRWQQMVSKGRTASDQSDRSESSESSESSDVEALPYGLVTRITAAAMASRAAALQSGEALWLGLIRRFLIGAAAVVLVLGVTWLAELKRPESLDFGMESNSEPLVWTL